MENILENAFTLKEISNTSKSFDVCIIMRNKSSKKVPVAEAIAMLKLEEGDVGD